MKTNKKSLAKISLTNIVSIDGYSSGENGNMYISQVDDLTLFKGFKNQDKHGVKLLIATAKVPVKSKLNQQYGDFIIVIDKRFNKLTKKQKLALIEIENSKRRMDTRLILNYDGEDDSASYFMEENELSAMLLAMEKYGYGVTKRAVNKANNFTMKTTKRNGKYMHKAFKKASKENDKVVIETPITLENA